MQPEVGIIIVHWGSVEDTRACLQAVATLDYPWRRTIVVDNTGTLSAEDVQVRRPPLASAGPTTDRAPADRVELLRAVRNLGYAGGNNLGMRAAFEHGCHYVWLLNNDVTVAADALSKLVAAAERQPAAGLLGPIVYMREDPQRILMAGGVFRPGAEPAMRGLGELDAGQYRTTRNVEYLSGCALLATRQVVERVGPLDEDFFLYCEDVEWCLRARRAGFEVLLVPQAKVWHPDTTRRDEFATAVVYYTARNSLLLLRKHGYGHTALLRVIGRQLRTLASWSVRPKWRGKRTQRNALARALGDALLGRVGPMAAKRSARALLPDGRVATCS